MINSQTLEGELRSNLRRTVIEVLQTLGHNSQGVAQHALVSALMELALFRDSCQGQAPDTYVLQILQDLRAEGAIHVDERPSACENQCRWQVNTADTSAMMLDTSHYLALLLLGLDHFLVREGYPFIHQHTLVRRLVLYIEERNVDAVYQLALQRQWLQRQEANENEHSGADNRWSVWIADEQEEVQAVLFNRNLMLDTLYKKGKAQKLTRDAFKSLLKMEPRCSLKPGEIDEWILTLQRDGLFLVSADEDGDGSDYIQLNLASHLVRRLLGRMHLCGVVLALRILGATHPERKKPLQEAVTFMAKIATHGDQMLAGWAIEYAKSIRLVVYGKRSTPDGDIDVVHMKRHRVVYNLDQRETAICLSLISLVRKLGQHHLYDGWVARPIVLQAMEKDSGFGYFQGEHEYWINQAVHRHLLDRHVERLPGRAPQNYLRVQGNGQLYV